MRLRDCFYNVTSTLYCMYDDLSLDGLGGWEIPKLKYWCEINIVICAWIIENNFVPWAKSSSHGKVENPCPLKRDHKYPSKL